MVQMRSLLAHPELGLTLVTRGADQRDLGWLAVGSRDEVLEHGNADAFVVIDGTAGDRDTISWRTFVAELTRLRVPLVGYRVLNGADDVPGELVRTAAAFRITLVRVPAHVTHLELARAIADLARSDHIRGAREALLTQRTLLELVHVGTGPAGIVATVASLTGRPTAILDGAGEVVAATSGFTHEGTRQELDIGSGRQLVVHGEELDPDATAAFTAAAIVLSIEDRTHTHNTVLERERWGRVTRAIVTGDPHAESLAALLDPDQRIPRVVHVVVVQGPAETIAEWRSEPRTGTDRLITRYPIEDHTGTEIAPGVALAWQVVAPEHLTSALESIAGYGLDAVVGLATDVTQATLSRRSAEALLPRLSAAEQLYQTPRVPRVLRAAHSTPFIARLTGTREAAALAQQRLGALYRAEDPREASDLRTTLETFLAHHGQRGSTADALGIHRNTLRSRLARIETLLDCSLESADDRAELWIALRLDSASHP